MALEEKNEGTGMGQRTAASGEVRVYNELDELEHVVL